MHDEYAIEMKLEGDRRDADLADMEAYEADLEMYFSQPRGSRDMFHPMLQAFEARGLHQFEQSHDLGVAA